MPLGDLAELLEPRHSTGIEPERIIDLLVGAVVQNEGRRPLILLLLPDRLELAPCRKDAHHFDACRRERRYVLLDRRFVPFVCAPHPDARLRAPVIDADEHLPFDGEYPFRGNRRGERRSECCQCCQYCQFHFQPPEYASRQVREVREVSFLESLCGLSVLCVSLTSGLSN